MPLTRDTLPADPMNAPPLDLAKIARAYSSPPWWYDLRGFFILTTSYQSTLWSQVAFFERNLGARHLEVAVGTGTLLKMILRYRKLRGRPMPDLAGFDYSERMLDGAKRAFAKWPGVHLSREDVTAIRAADESFDTVNIANAFHCFADPRAALAETRRVLKPGGRLAMNVLLHPRGVWPLRKLAEAINRWGTRKGILVAPFERESLLRMVAEAGFDVTEERVGGNCCSLVAVKKEG